MNILNRAGELFQRLGVKEKKVPLRKAEEFRAADYISGFEGPNGLNVKFNEMFGRTDRVVVTTEVLNIDREYIPLENNPGGNTVRETTGPYCGSGNIVFETPDGTIILKPETFCGAGFGTETGTFYTEHYHQDKDGNVDRSVVKRRSWKKQQ